MIKYKVVIIFLFYVNMRKLLLIYMLINSL